MLSLIHIFAQLDSLVDSSNAQVIRTRVESRLGATHGAMPIGVGFDAVSYTHLQMKPGEVLHDFVGPLGNPTELEGVRRACVIGGGLGTAIAYPQAKWLYDHGCEVDVITGFRTASLSILEDEIAACSARQIVMTDDGSNGNKGLVTQALQQRIDEEMCIRDRA